MKEVIKANSILEAYENNLEKAIEFVDVMLMATSIRNMPKIDFWLDVRNVLKVIA